MLTITSSQITSATSSSSCITPLQGFLHATISLILKCNFSFLFSYCSALLCRKRWEGGKASGQWCYYWEKDRASWGSGVQNEASVSLKRIGFSMNEQAQQWPQRIPSPKTHMKQKFNKAERCFINEKKDLMNTVHWYSPPPRNVLCLKNPNCWPNKMIKSPVLLHVKPCLFSLSFLLILQWPQIGLQFPTS